MPKRQHALIECASKKLHDIWACEPNTTLVHESKLKLVVKNKLLSLSGRELLPSTKYKQSLRFCQSCLDEVIVKHPEVNLETVTNKEDHSYFQDKNSSKIVKRKRSTVDNIVSEIKNLTAEERAIVAYELGKCESEKIVLDCQSLSSNRSLDSLLKNLKLDKYVKQRNPTVVGFLCGLAKRDFPIDCEKITQQAGHVDRSVYHLCKTVESIMHYVSPCVLPLHLNESTLIYSMTGSKFVLQITSLGSAYASYQVVRKWLNSLAGDKPTCPEGDIVNVFDNNQVLQRRWRVKLNNKFKCDVVTMVVVFVINGEGNLESQIAFKPGKWMSSIITDENISKVKKIDLDPCVKKIQSTHLASFITERLKHVVEEQKWVSNKWEDMIDDDVQIGIRNKTFKHCHSCGFNEVPKNRRVCPSCNKNLKQSEMESLGVDKNGTYTAKTSIEKTKREFRMHVEIDSSRNRGCSIQHHEQQANLERTDYSSYECKTSEKCESSLQDPIFVNPCSYDTVTTVLVAIGSNSGIKQYGTGEREWMIVVCDGLPYGLCKRIILCTYRCQYCKSLVYGTDNSAKHREDHETDQEIIFKMEFEWVLLVPGPGHIEMNMVRAYVELTWEIFWKDMIALYHFLSPTALICAKKVTDHHKGWTLCKIARCALTDELLVPFVRSAMAEAGTKDIQLSAAHFFKFVMSAKDPTYALIADCVFELLDSVFLYRTGVRCGQIDMMDAGRAKFAKVWFGRTHPLYRELEVTDSLMRERMPPELKDLLTCTLSLNTSGVPYTAEGADFKLEAVNKQVQNLLPNNPTGEDWVNACANHHKVILLRKSLFESAGIKDPSERVFSHHHTQDLEKEIRSFRTLLRSKEWLIHPNLQAPLTSLSGSPLNPELQDFCSKSREIRSRYVDVLLESDREASSKPPKRTHFSEQIITVTLQEKQEYESVENQTVAKIKEMIYSSISEIVDDEMKESFQAIYEDDVLKGGRPTKGDFIDFYQELNSYIETQSIDLPINGTLSEPLEDELSE